MWQSDGQIDFSEYTRSELQEAIESIDRDKYPQNYQNLITTLEAKGSIESEKANKESPQTIPVGRYERIKTAIPIKAYPLLRVLLVVAAVFFGVLAYQALETGEIVGKRGRYTLTRENDGFLFFARVSLYVVISLFSAWEAAFGFAKKAPPEN